MSRKLSLKEALALQADARDERRTPSDSRGEARKIRFRLAPLDIAQPVQLARTLMDFGISLRKAHEALNRLAEGETVAVELDAGDVSLIAARLKALGVDAARVVLPTPDIKKIREKLGVSQAEFAVRFGLELDTLQNWEQGRNQPDPAARLLLKVIELHPEVVAGVLAEEGVAI
jgi:DNA-binding transcriptional regulator YiaG